MTKKDFQLIASTIYNLNLVPAAPLTCGAQRKMIAEAFADALATTNPLFKRELFIQAATGQVEVTARKPKPDAERWPGGVQANGMPKINTANSRAVDARRTERSSARTLASDLAEDR